MMTVPAWHAGLADILAEIGTLPPDRRFTYPIRRGTMRAGVYAPPGHDDQTSHDQDELYIIACGTARFIKQDQTVTVKAQDLLFVEAGVDHRFVDMSVDFATWVVFWGPPGGEA